MSEQVTTREELDELPDRSVVLDSDGDAWAKEGDIWVFGINRWDAALLLGSAPLAVLHIPGRPHAPQRVQPSREAIKEAIRSGWWPDDRKRLSFSYNKVTQAVLAVLAFQPTVAEVRERAADEIAATAKVIRDAHGGAPPDVVGHILAGYAQAEGVVRAAEGGAR